MSETRRLFLISCLACVLAVYEISARTFLPLPYAYFFPAFGILVFGIFHGWKTEALAFAFILGGTHDVFGFQQRFWFAALPLAVLFLRFIALNVMTNRSMYSAIGLVLLARLFLGIWELLAFVLARWSGDVFFLPSWSEEWRVLFWDAFFVALLFIVPVVFRLLARRLWSAPSSFSYGKRA